jgi:hypothetical protein
MCLDRSFDVGWKASKFGAQLSKSVAAAQKLLTNAQAAAEPWNGKSKN